MVSALILDNLDFVEFSNFSPIVATAILVSILGFSMTSLKFLHLTNT